MGYGHSPNTVALHDDVEWLRKMGINTLQAQPISRGRSLAYLTIGWNSLAGLIAVGAGIVAGSIALVGFGIDSVIEVSSGAIILWLYQSGGSLVVLLCRFSFGL
jgi:hypothetical protein